MLIRKSAPHPLLRKTARGGRKIATMYANTSAYRFVIRRYSWHWKNYRILDHPAFFIVSGVRLVDTFIYGVEERLFMMGGCLSHSWPCFNILPRSSVILSRGLTHESLGFISGSIHRADSRGSVKEWLKRTEEDAVAILTEFDSVSFSLSWFFRREFFTYGRVCE